LKAYPALVTFAVLAATLSASEPEMEIAAPRLPGRVEAQSNFYADDHGLYVSTTGGEAEHPLGGTLALKLRALADWIGIYPPDDYVEDHSHHLPGGHVHDPGGNPDAGPGGSVDAISAASARAGSGGGAQELRGELAAGLLRRTRPGGRPLALGLEARVGATASASLEANRGNTTMSGHGGFSLERINPDPSQASAGEEWPARQLKIAAGSAVSQTLTPRLAVSAGASGAYMVGRLSSPYRRALIVTTLFPERLPADRLRTTAFAQAGYYLGKVLGNGMALHSRQGFYIDTWGAKAWIPETALALEMGPRLLLTLKQRSYVQRPASFYKTVYAPTDRLRTGDTRLGGLEEHGGGIEIDWSLPRGAGARGPLILSLGYAFSRLEYWSLPGHDLRSHVARLGATVDY
jgi:hypothetical protein